MKSIQTNNISVDTIDTIIQELQKELEMYQQDKNSVKEFYPCSQELTRYLEAQKR